MSKLLSTKVKAAVYRSRLFELTCRLKTKVTLLLLLTVSAAATAAPLNGLYFGLDNMRGFAEVYWWFLPDGRVLRDTLPAGLSADKFDAACQQHSGFCANYTLSGNKLTVQYRTGNSETWSYKPLNGGIQLNYLILTPVEKYPVRLAVERHLGTGLCRDRPRFARFEHDNRVSLFLFF